MIRIDNPQYFYFLQQADALRHSGSLCDAIISVKSQTFRAHRLVLACASRRLAQRLALGDIDNPVHCKLDYFSPHTFQQVLDFTYTQTLEVSVDDLHLLLRAAQLLEMQPLEDQCRKHLENIHCRVREESKIRKIIHVKKETENVKQIDEKEKERLAQEREKSSSDEVGNTNVIENISPTGLLRKHYISPPSTKKNPRLLPVSETLYNRESVITRPASSGSSFSSPLAFPNMWNSVSTLRQIAKNYSNLVAAQPLQPPNQSPVAYPFSFTSSHMLPLLGSHFHSSVMAYSGFHPGHEQNLYVGSTRMEGIINQGLLKRKRRSQIPSNETVQTSEQSNHNGPTASIARVKDCQHTSANLLDDPVLQKSVYSPSGEKPFECRLCGQRSRDYSAMIKHLRTHGGATPYQCTVCLEFCSSLVAMQRHVKSHALQDFPQNWSINSTYLYKSHI
ncbi:zinc finger and BTB domain-containing protein 16 isoform X2 [Antennarius striatus]|uniref:zinc finger and BTB domain-containing protein 16 isoform X2 n=1 Tax=Antennarius striatus TaxID=241820 RepID=UPI0035AF291D